jgi:hypothetical protein
VEALIKNTGDVLFRAADGTTVGCPNGSVHYAELRLRQVLPVQGALAGIGDASCAPVREGGAEIEWPQLDRKEWCVEKHPFELEPGESDPLHADFIVPANVSVVQFYFYVHNPKKKDIGWACTKFYDFKGSIEVTEMADKKESTESRLNEQQRQQKQQQQQNKQGDQSKKKK